MQLRYFGGFALEGADAGAPAVRGRGQEAVLFRLALDAGTAVGYRALAEDVWPDDPPDDPRAALQSLVSRLRRALPADTIDAVSGGYRLVADRADVDLTRFQDLVARARRTADPALAREALALWKGDPWTPGDGFDWVLRDLLEDRAHAERLIAGAPAEAGSLPAPMTSLVGRLDELDAIGRQLDAERLVTLIGPGGAGKTTLALETARRRSGATVFVELAPAAPGDVWAAVAGAVGRSIRLNDAGALPPGARERALVALEGRTVLVVLDNCEHVSAEAAEVATAVLHAVPGARVLATSREPLGTVGEAFVDLGPLPAADARELFDRRVRAARGTEPTDAERPAVERIVRRLDGLPLALELAAAKTRVLTIAEVDEGLDDRFALLATGPKAIEPRHRTLRALIDWSWETLTDPERAGLLLAAVFPDGIGAADASVVAAEADLDATVFDALVDRSLLHRTDGRYRMLETVREYGIDRLRSAGDEPACRARQARALVTLAATHDALLRGPRVREGLAWFDANEENLSAALRASESADGRATGLRLVRACLWAWMMRERFEELMSGIQRFAPEEGAIDSEPAVIVGGVALMFASFAAVSGFLPDGSAPVDDDGRFAERREEIADAAARYPSELSSAVVLLLAAAAHALADREQGAPWSSGFVIPEPDAEAPDWTRAFVWLLRSAIAQNGGDVETLGLESERALELFTRLGDVWGRAFASQMRSEWLMLEGRLEESLAVADATTEGLQGLTSIADAVQQRSQGVNLLVRLGRFDEARERLRVIDALAEEDGSVRALAQARMTAASVAVGEGDGAGALAELDALDPTFAQGFPDQLIAWSLSKRAQALLLLDRPGDAAEALRQAIPSAQRSGDQPIIAEVALSLAGWLAAAGRDADARRALAASAAMRGRVDESDPSYRRLVERLDAAPEESSGAASDLTALAALLD